MVTYEYRSSLVKAQYVEENVNSLGSQGWRLHTAEPIIFSGAIYALIVMDRAYEGEEPEEPVEENTGPHGIEMKAGPS